MSNPSEWLTKKKKPRSSKPKPSGTMVVKESSNMSPTLTIAVQFAYAYARTKKRWFDGKKGWDGSKDEYGLTLDPHVTGEKDFRSFREMVKRLKHHYSYDLLN